MKKVLALMLTLALTATLVLSLAACGKQGGNDEEGNKYGNRKIAALITLHGSASTYDKNFIDAFKQAAANKGLTEENYTIVSDIDEKAVCYDTAADLADQGYKAIFADSFGHEDYLIQAAKEFTDVQFYHATGTKAHTENLANFHNAFASIYEGRYLAGYAAGLKLNTMKEKAVDNNFKVGYIGAYTYAEVISGYTSWFLGLQAALEEGYTATMDVIFTGSWYDETAEKESAQTLINDKNCVLISQHADSMGAPTACEDASVPDVAYNGTTGKSTMVAYSKINWVPYFEAMIDQATGGAAVAKDFVGTLSDGSVQYALGDAAAEGTAAALEAVKAKLLDGSLKVFDCSKFTVGGEHLTSYLADVNTDADFTPDTEAIVKDGETYYFAESSKRSAPYFDLWIDGITLINTKF